MKTRGAVGWIFLAVVLAVPALMYYKSWHAKETSRKLAAQHKKRVPPEGIFPEAADSMKLSNPIAGEPAPGTGPADAGMPVSTAAADAAAGTVVEAASAQPADGPGGDASDGSVPEGGVPDGISAAPAEASSADPAAAPAAAETHAAVSPADSPSTGAPAPDGQEPAAATTPGIQPGAEAGSDLVAQDWRDPMLSPYDHFLIEQEELQRLIKRREVEERVKLLRQKKAPKPAETTISLQGIVSMPEGNKAIINGDMKGEGEMVGDIKVLTITPQKVIFLHNGKRFTKQMQ